MPRQKYRPYLSRASPAKKGFVQTDYIIAIGIFLVIFAVVVQYVTNYFSTVGKDTSLRIINSQTTSLLDVVERGYQPDGWPYFSANSSVLMLLHLDNSTLDGSQYGNNGTISGANCSAVIAGRLNGGCSLDGTSAYISVNDQAVLNFTTGSSFSVEAWINPQALAGSNWSIASKQNTVSSAGWRMFLNTTSRELMTTLTDGTNSITLMSYNSAANSSWSHAAFTVDRSGNTSSLYLNGAVVNSTNISSIGSLRNNEPVRIGGIGSGQYFNGTIDEVALWNRSLSAGEVYNSYAYENSLDRIGLSTKAYRFYIIVNNTQPYQRNQTAPIAGLTEIVRFNYSDIAAADVPSTYIYDDYGSAVPYNINGNIITFNSSVNASQGRIYTV